MIFVKGAKHFLPALIGTMQLNRRASVSYSHTVRDLEMEDSMPSPWLPIPDLEDGALGTHAVMCSLRKKT